MTPHLRGTSIYRIRDERLKAVNPAAASPDSLLLAVLRSDGEPTTIFRGRVPRGGPRLALALETRSAGRPKWCDVLQPAFDTSFESFTVSSIAGVLLVLPPESVAPAFVLALGTGRYMLDPEAVEPNFGLRVALNAISGPSAKASAWIPERIRSVDARRVAGNTITTRRQASRRTSFEEFDVDVQRDLVRSVTGVPVDSEWGGRISGADACRLTRPVSLLELGQVCQDLEGLFHEVHYRTHFAWVDHVRHVTDIRTRRRLDEAVVRALRVPPGSLGHTASLELAPPDPLEWDDVEEFRFSIRSDEAADDATIAHLRALLQRDGAIDSLDVEYLKHHSVVAYLTSGEERKWSIYRCLTGEVRHRDLIYLLDNGQYYEVSADYLSNLDAFVAGIPRRHDPMPYWRGQLPPPLSRSEREEDYNEYAVGELPGAVLLDRKTVRIGSRTSPVEVCDILTAAGELIHVKPKHNSSVLSHLFAQGAVSADLLLKNQQFREGALGQVERAINSRGAALGESEANRLRGLFGAPLNPRELCVVYAIGADWGGRPLSRVLPFFSKVNLRAHVESLRAMGYVVNYAPVERAAATRESGRPRRRRRDAVPAAGSD